MSRKVTNQLITAVEEGLLSWQAVAMEALSYMSEADVADMAHRGELLDNEETDEDEDEDEETDA